MMENIHLAGEDDDDDDDLYSDFNVDNSAQQFIEDESFQQAVKTSYGRRPPQTSTLARGVPSGLNAASGLNRGAKGLPTGAVGASRPITGAVGGDSSARPMTAIAGAGFMSRAKAQQVETAFGAGGGSSGPVPSLDPNQDDAPEEKMKIMEKKVMELIEESCLLASKGSVSESLEMAKEAGRKERQLCRQREQLSSAENNLDLTYAVLFNLANSYTYNEMYPEALNTYQIIVRNKTFMNAGRLKVNMGNICMKQKNYQKALRLYRMALDQIPNTHKELRRKIMRNIGLCFVKMGQYSDAITSYEYIMNEGPCLKTAINLILCHYAINDREKMKTAFQKMMTVSIGAEDEDKYQTRANDKQWNSLLEVIRSDPLRQQERRRKAEAEKNILTATKLIAPVIEASFVEGYNWCIDQVKNSHFVEMAPELEITKALHFLKAKDTSHAIETLKSFEKKDTKMAPAAAVNLAFLYFFENDLTQAAKYADAAVAADRYNPLALVNKGAIHYRQGDYEKAKEFFREALSNEATNVEALYNLGLVNRKLGLLEESLDGFYKLHSILRGSASVIRQIAEIYEAMGESAQSTEWHLQLLGIVPTDPGGLKRLGEIYEDSGDKTSAYHYHLDSFRYFPSNIKTIEWLGAYFIESQLWEKAISYFSRAATVQPNDERWRLMVASCHRRAGNYQKAFETYKEIHAKFPDNVECLKFLVRICTDMGMKEAEDYAVKLKKAEKQREQTEAKQQSERRSGGKTRGSRDEKSSGGDLSSKSFGFDESKNNDDLFGGGGGGGVSSSYSDPLGAASPALRSKPASRPKGVDEDGFGDDDLPDDLLPE